MAGEKDPRILVLEEMRKQTALLERIAAALTNGANSNAPAVPDRILDGPHGDPEVKAKDPRDWAGDSMRGKRFSECPAEYLDLVASRLDYFAEGHESVLNDEEAKKKAKFERLDAQRARGWAARKRAGWVAPASTVSTADDFAQGAEPQW